MLTIVPKMGGSKFMFIGFGLSAQVVGNLVRNFENRASKDGPIFSIDVIEPIKSFVDVDKQLKGDDAQLVLIFHSSTQLPYFDENDALVQSAGTRLRASQVTLYPKNTLPSCDGLVQTYFLPGTPTPDGT